MPESSSHIRLVQALVKWISESFFSGEMSAVFVDGPDSSKGTKPPNIYNFIPDVYVPYQMANLFIIGEAKTPRDLETNHTIDQFKAFLSKCSEYDNSLFVLAVRWDLVRLGHSIIKHAMHKVGATNVKTIVIEMLPG